ncbi:MAG TPA: HD domain-containing phosphohydrolase [Herpetosiphonaceae bacterium]
MQITQALSAPTTTPRLLVVEDDPLVRTVCVRLLKMRQYEVDQVDNGLRALERLGEAAYDIVLTDLSMPLLNGLGLLRQVRERYPDTDTIMITAFGSIDTAKQAIKLGAFDYLTKPLELDDLERTVQTCLEMRELKRLRNERETLSEMVALMELSRTISARLDVTSQIRDFIGQLRNRFSPTSVALSLLDPNEHKLTLMDQKGIANGIDVGRAVALTRLSSDESIVRAHADLVNHHETENQIMHVLRVQDRPVGVLQMTWSESMPLSGKDAQLFEVFTSSMAVALENGRLYSKLKHQNLQTIAALAAAIDARDTYTSGHSEQVTKYAVRMAEVMEQTETWIERLRYGALLHDVGKIGVPDSILLKPGALTPEEFERMKQHPITGARIVERVLDDVRDIIRHHHERYDGTGYPDGLKGEEIPLESRVIAVADALDAMTSDRAYRKGMSVEQAVKILRAGRNEQWQGDIVDVLIDLIESEGETLLEGKDRPAQATFCDGNIGTLIQ